LILASNSKGKAMNRTLRIHRSEAGYPMATVWDGSVKVAFGDIDTTDADSARCSIADWITEYPVQLISVALPDAKVWDAARQFCADSGIEYVNTCG
jgi:hypothetical protein